MDNIIKHQSLYEINESKFLKALADGISFKTHYQDINFKQYGEKKMFEQTLQYNLYCDKFLELNKIKLLELGIIKLKTR